LSGRYLVDGNFLPEDPKKLSADPRKGKGSQTVRRDPLDGFFQDPADRSAEADLSFGVMLLQHVAAVHP